MHSTLIGTALKTLRGVAEMTLDDVAAAAGVSVSYLSRAERGLVTPTPGWVSVVAQSIGERLESQSLQRGLVRP